MMLAFQDMMKAQIVMPAELMRETGGERGEAYSHFAAAAERLGVYTSKDYLAIMRSLIKEWDIANQTPQSPEARKAQEFLLNLPGRMQKLVERRAVANQKTLDAVPEFKSKWILE